MAINMRNLDLLGRTQRTIRCQMRKYYNKKWRAVKPQDFYANPERVTALWYAAREGRMPNFAHPTDFNEQLMAINLRAYRNEYQRQLRIVGADKYAVRQYVADKGYADILNECYGVWDSFDEIDFDKLPNQFVLKLTNGSGCNCICKDKSQFDKALWKKQFDEWTAEMDEFGLTTGEWHYSQIKSRIIAEKYLTTLGEDISIIDYKFHCVNHQVYGEYICYDRIPGTHSVNYDHYDADWNLTDGVMPAFHPTQRPIARPKTFEKMKEIAVALSEDLEYVRVDLYEIDGKILFGELTYTPMGNYLPYTHKQLVDMERFFEKTKA